MGRYIKNGLAFARGAFALLISKLQKSRTIEPKVRIFPSATLDIDRGAKIAIGRGGKIRERAVISIRDGGALEIGESASVGMDCKIAVHEKVVIGEGTLLSPNVLIYDHDHVFDDKVGVYRKEFKSKPIVIGKNCWIGANTIILRGTTIGDNCIVGAGCVLHGAYGNGCIIVQKRNTQIIETVKDE